MPRIHTIHATVSSSQIPFVIEINPYHLTEERRASHFRLRLWPCKSPQGFVRGEDRFQILGDEEHVRPLLDRAEQRVDLVARRIVAADRHVGLGREIDLATAGGPSS